MANEDYKRGVIDAYRYVIEELGLDISDSDLIKNLNLEMTECPNHGGAFDCTTFCNICEGYQEY
jgi:hypothetical protein